MKTVSGKIVSTKPVNLSKAANILSNFATSDNGASQSVSAYLSRASAAFNELLYFKKHHKLEKDPSKEEASTKSDIGHRSVQENKVRVQENGALNMNFDHDAVDNKEFGTRKVEGKLKKKKEKKKKDGSLVSGKNDDIEVDDEQGNKNVKGKREEKKKKKKDGSLGSGKNDNTEVDFEQGNENVKENSEEKKKKKKKRKNAEVDGGETSNLFSPESKKRRKTEADDE